MASRDELLVRLHDSELSVAEMEQLRAELTEEDQNKLSALAEVDTFLHDVLSQQADEHQRRAEGKRQPTHDQAWPCHQSLRPPL